MKVNVNNEIIYYNEKGEGIPFVMLHGNMTSSVHLDVLYEHLPNNIRLITPDMRGFGKSSYNNSFDSLEELATDIYELVCKLNIKECCIGGWSTGGGVAMILAAKYPTIFKKLVLVESVGITGYPIFQKDENLQPIIGKYIETKVQLANDKVQVVPILHAYETGNKEVLKHMWNTLIYNNGNYPDEKRYDKYLDDMLTQRNLVDVDYALLNFNISDTHNGVCHGSGLYKEIKQSTLVIQGNNDLVVPLTMNKTITDNLLNCEVVYGDFGHSPFIDCPKFVCSKIYEFISK